MKHVNNAVYMDWLEEALADASAPLASPTQQLRVGAHDIEYVRSALPGDEVEIVVRLAGAGTQPAQWLLEIGRGGELLLPIKSRRCGKMRREKPVRGWKQ